MTERGILFSGAMVRALLDGTKTQTRRAVKSRYELEFLPLDDDGPIWPHLVPRSEMLEEQPLNCPYGQPGDRLWVREAWLEDPEDDGTWHYTQYMGCKGSPLSDIPKKFQKPKYCIYREGWTGHDLRWRPSIHMPRWASRILLEIVSVRIERLQDISDQDAIAEGLPWRQCTDWMGPGGTRRDFGPKDAYRELWESINGAGSWDANPWVWVVEFRRIES